MCHGRLLGAINPRSIIAWTRWKRSHRHSPREALDLDHRKKKKITTLGGDWFDKERELGAVDGSALEWLPSLVDQLNIRPMSLDCLSLPTWVHDGAHRGSCFNSPKSFSVAGFPRLVSSGASRHRATGLSSVQNALSFFRQKQLNTRRPR